MWSRRIGPGSFLLILMMAAGSPACAQVYAAAATAPAGLSSSIRTLVNPAAAGAPTRRLNDEVQVVAPDGPVMLAQEFELRLEGGTSALDRISVTQWAETADGQWREIYQGFASGPGERRGDAMVVKVVPYQLGRLQLRVAGSGRAGDELETLHKQVLVQVAEPPAGPVELRLGQAGRPEWEGDARMMNAKLGLKGSGRPFQMKLAVEAVYGGVLEPQPVEAREVQFRVRDGAQIIRVDQRTGVVRGLKPGHALVEASYGGMTRQACVIVQRSAGVRIQTKCGELAAR